MSTGYAIAYRLGFTPWEKAGRDDAEQFGRLLDREQEGRTPPLGRALDLGCGTGDHAVELARRGWDVTAVDLVPRALDAARGKAARAGVDVRFLRADVTDLAPAVGGGYRLLLDVGCFHGLTPQQRAAYARQVDAVSEPGSVLLVLAFSPGHRPPVPLPRGASRDELERTFAHWQLVDDDPVDTSRLHGPARWAAPHFFRFRRLS